MLGNRINVKHTFVYLFFLFFFVSTIKSYDVIDRFFLFQFPQNENDFSIRKFMKKQKISKSFLSEKKVILKKYG